MRRRRGRRRSPGFQRSSAASLIRWWMRITKPMMIPTLTSHASDLQLERVQLHVVPAEPRLFIHYQMPHQTPSATLQSQEIVR